MKTESVGLQISLDVEGRRALVVGGDDEAADKVNRLLDGGALVTVVAQPAGGAIESLAQRSKLTLLQREFYNADVRDADVVLICTRDAALAGRVYDAANADGAAVWTMDDPARSHFAMPALARAGKVRIAISTSGAAPALAGKLRAAFERDLDQRFRKLVDHLAAERVRVQKEEPDEAKRRELLRGLVDQIEFALSVSYPP